MSDDLIRRQAIKSQIETIRDCWRISPFVSSSDMKLYEKAFNVVLTTISDCHTAFDKGKVITELLSQSIICLAGDEPYIMLDKAIEIVEKGGIE